MTIDSAMIASQVSTALAEDVGSGDVTAALLPSSQHVIAEIISREPMVVCGQAWVNEVFRQVDPAIRVEWKVRESEKLSSPETLCRIEGNARTVLTAERTALNFLQTLSATATQVSQYVEKLKETSVRLLDTRKTIPGLRLAQKYAVRCGGGTNHRMGLYDAFLIKENHIKACGSISKAINLARETHQNLLVEIEVENLDEFQQALDAQPDRIMLDNFNLEQLHQAVKMKKNHNCELEVSGGINLETIQDVAKTGVDYISVGAITKSIQAIDLSLLIREVK